MQRSQASQNWRQRDPNPPLAPVARTVASAPNSANRLYVGNLPYQAGKEEISALFASNNFVVERIDISTDPLSGRNPSYCFVDVINNDEVERAMRELPGQLILGRPVKINIVVAKVATGGSSGAKPLPHTPGYLNAGKQPRERERVSPNGSPDAVRPPRTQTFDRWNTQTGTRSRGEGIVEEGRRLYVGRLPRMEPPAAARAEIERIFDGFHVEAISKMMSPPTTKQGSEEQEVGRVGNHYYCFVDFANSEEAAEAMDAKNGAKMPWGNQLRVNIARNRASGKPPREQSKTNGPIATAQRQGLPFVEAE